MLGTQKKVAIPKVLSPVPPVVQPLEALKSDRALVTPGKRIHHGFFGWPKKNLGKSSTI